MSIYRETLELRPRGQGMEAITAEVAAIVRRSGVREGLVHVFATHTSASLVLMENADPEARADLQAWMDRLVPRGDSLYTHTYEGPDDMPSHIKMALTRTSETLPIGDGNLMLGTWQGLYWWEHRDHPGLRRLVVTVFG